MIAYKGCPFCDHVFDIRSDRQYGLREHIRAIHTHSERGGRKVPPTILLSLVPGFVVLPHIHIR